MREEGGPPALIKPETKQFLHRLWLTFSILGSLIALLIVSGWAINSVFARVARQKEDQTVLGQLQAQAEKPLATQIKEREAALAKLLDPVSRDEEQRNLARLYERQGSVRIQEGKKDEAEASFRRAAELAPGDPIYAADLALLFALAARDESSRPAQIELWKESALQWLRAVSLEEKPEIRNTYAQSAVDAALTACELLSQAKRKEDGLTFLKEVRLRMPPKSSLNDQLDRMEEILKS